MSEIEEGLNAGVRRRGKVSSFRIGVWVVIPLAAILFEVYVPRFLEYLAYLELSLLVTVYFALMRRQPIAGAIIGMLIGLGQDSLSQHPIGMFGIVKTLVGYFAASVSMRFDVDSSALRFMLAFFFFLFHQFFFWVMAGALLGQAREFQLPQTIIVAFLNAVVAVPLFWILDRLKVEAR
jgi:rod shape-determining protein MreD